MGLWNKRWPQVFGTRLFTILNILQTLVYGKTKAGIRIAAAGIAFVYEKWSAGIRMPAAGIAMPAAGIAICIQKMERRHLTPFGILKI